jgi:myo-inositol-1(or 4)-monophosphatase
MSFGVLHELKSGQRFWAGREQGARAETASGKPITLRLSQNTDPRRMFWTAGTRGRPLLPVSVVLEELVDGCSLGGGYFDLGSASFNMTRIVTGQLDAYVDVGRRIVDECPETEPAFLEVGEGSITTNFPYDVAASMLIVREAGGIVTHADGRRLDDHPAVGSSRTHGLAVLAAANAPLHETILAAVDRGMHRLRDWVGTSRVPPPRAQE